MSSTSLSSETRYREVRYEATGNLIQILDHLGVSLLVSTYQAGKVLCLGSHSGQLQLSFLHFDRAMGLAADSNRIAIGSRRQIHFLHSAKEIARRIPSKDGLLGTHDNCYAMRQSRYTGNIHGHDLAWGNEGLWVVNTLFSCLCTLDDGYSFVPRWRPPFVSQLIDQDRCHLNGLALQNGEPKFVTVLAESDEPAGWRPTKATSGRVLEVPSGETVVGGLAMPHSPRWYQDRLWVLDSGRGVLAAVDTAAGKIEDIEQVPGYTRGLAFAGQFAFVGLSKIRETNIFGGLPIAEKPELLRCGIAVIDLLTGRTVATFQFHSGVEEIFAVEVLPGTRNPALFGLTEDQEESSSEVWIVPPENLSPINKPVSNKPNQTVHTDPDVLMREGSLAHDKGNLHEALRCYLEAIQLKPSAELYSRLGNLHQDRGDAPAAMACYLKAIELQPDHATTLRNLGILYAAQSQPHRALHHLELAQEAAPHPMNWVLGAGILPIIYDSVEQVDYWRERLTSRVRNLAETGVVIDTTDSVIPTSFYYAYQGQNDRPLMQDLANVYQGLKCCQAANESDWKPKGKRLRIGFVSAYFCNHTIGRLNLGVIQNLSRKEFEVTVISLGSHNDSRSAAYKQAADHFVEVPRQPGIARRMIADLGLDVLIFTDVGMDCLSQTLCYSRMAPIQAVTWGHPDTTGSPAIDYFISSELAETLDADEHYSEQLVRLPTLGVYYEKTQLSGPPRDKVYFGLNPKRRVYLCPQTLFKFHPEFDDVLNRILQSDPDGDLVVIRSNVDAWNEALLQRWQRTLPDASMRVRFLPSQPRADFLHLLSVADVMLDPFPFCGGNTSYEAIAVGTPVVTKPGQFLRGRLTYAMYQRMKITLPIANTNDEYVALALRIANDNAFSNQVRRGIQATSPILFENTDDIHTYESMLHGLLESKNIPPSRRREIEVNYNRN